MTPIWLWPNLLSLDAPLVAIVWQAFLAQCFSAPLRASGRVVLALTVWCIYTADRLLDVRWPPAPAEFARHRFYRRHKRMAEWLLALALIADAFLIVLWLRPAVFHNGLIVLAGVILYFALVHASPNALRVPKEAAAALLFAAGTFLVAWTFSTKPWSTLLAPGVSYFVLCLANLVAIEVWESSERLNRYPGNPLLAQLGRHYAAWVAAFACVCFAASGLAWYRAVAVSAAATVVVFAGGRRLSPDLRRVLADGVLLSPLLFLR